MGQRLAIPVDREAGDNPAAGVEEGCQAPHDAEEAVGIREVVVRDGLVVPCADEEHRSKRQASAHNIMCCAARTQRKN